MRIPHDHQHLLGHYHMAGPKEIEMAINSLKNGAFEFIENPFDQARLLNFISHYRRINKKDG